MLTYGRPPGGRIVVVVVPTQSPPPSPQSNDGPPFEGGGPHQLSGRRGGAPGISQAGSSASGPGGCGVIGRAFGF